MGVQIKELKKARLVPNEPTYRLVDENGEPLEVTLIYKNCSNGEGYEQNLLIRQDLQLGEVYDVMKQYGVEVTNLEKYAEK